MNLGSVKKPLNVRVQQSRKKIIRDGPVKPEMNGNNRRIGQLLQAVKIGFLFNPDPPARV